MDSLRCGQGAIRLADHRRRVEEAGGDHHRIARLHPLEQKPRGEIDERTVLHTTRRVVQFARDVELGALGPATGHEDLRRDQAVRRFTDHLRQVKSNATIASPLGLPPRRCTAAQCRHESNDRNGRQHIEHRDTPKAKRYPTRHLTRQAERIGRDEAAQIAERIDDCDADAAAAPVKIMFGSCQKTAKGRPAILPVKAP